MPETGQQSNMWITWVSIAFGGGLELIRLVLPPLLRGVGIRVPTWMLVVMLWVGILLMVIPLALLVFPWLPVTIVTAILSVLTVFIWCIRKTKGQWRTVGYGEYAEESTHLQSVWVDLGLLLMFSALHGSVVIVVNQPHMLFSNDFRRANKQYQRLARRLGQSIWYVRFVEFLIGHRVQRHLDGTAFILNHKDLRSSHQRWYGGADFMEARHWNLKMQSYISVMDDGIRACESAINLNANGRYTEACQKLRDCLVRVRAIYLSEAELAQELLRHEQQ